MMRPRSAFDDLMQKPPKPDIAQLRRAFERSHGALEDALQLAESHNGKAVERVLLKAVRDAANETAGRADALAKALDVEVDA